MNVCEAGHVAHVSKLVATIQGPMWVWDTDLYMGQAGVYCSGQDDVSQTLARLGVWEAPESVDFMRALMSDRGGSLVLDFGAHVGWYSRLAAREGFDVCAFEGDAENLTLLHRNVRGLAGSVQAHHAWIDEAFTLPPLSGDSIRLVKMDLEGSERHAVAALEPIMDRVHAIVMEVSPCFNASYPALVERVKGHGFEVFRGREPWDGLWDFHQDNFWFRRSHG